jgi:hypothetical protein
MKTPIMGNEYPATSGRWGSTGEGLSIRRARKPRDYRQEVSTSNRVTSTSCTARVPVEGECSTKRLRTSDENEIKPFPEWSMFKVHI